MNPRALTGAGIVSALSEAVKPRKPDALDVYEALAIESFALKVAADDIRLARSLRANPRRFVTDARAAIRRAAEAIQQYEDGK
jgi:hypothetical protein